ncbi:MAG TPA: CBS domain-containing protein [Rhodospirillales bacterium]|nr:CBS domain-containing protein [Rhodospirillales bacterium]
MNAEDVMRREVHVVGPGTLLVEAARIMTEHEIGFLPVVDDNVLIGVVTDRDIVVRGVAEGCHPTQATVGDIMSVEIVCCYPQESTDSIKQHMAEHGFSRVPVINEDHSLVGLLSSSNVDGQPAGRKKGLNVIFQKEKTDSYGRPHKVPVKTVYITGKASKEEAVEAAVKHFEAEQKTPWRTAADSIEVEDGPESEGSKPA